MASIKQRVKQAMKNGDVQFGKEGWITNGHFAVHRGVFIRQGLDLAREYSAEADRSFFSGMGITGAEFRVSKVEVDKVRPVKRGLIEFNATQFFLDTNGEPKRLFVSSEKKKPVALVNERYLGILDTQVELLKLWGHDLKSALINSDNPNDASYLVMPVILDEDDLDAIRRLAGSVLDKNKD